MIPGIRNLGTKYLILSSRHTSPPKLDIVPSGNLRFLAVRRMTYSDFEAWTPNWNTSLKAVIRYSPSGQTTLLESSVGTVEKVLTLMREVNWVHFVCHGIRDSESPIDTGSGLCLADQRHLKLSDAISLSRPHDGLAFLSACQTVATGDKKFSDEAIYIATGMLFAGYGRVTGTMWSINLKDSVAPQVAKDVYERLFRNGTTPDRRDSGVCTSAS